MDELKLYKQTIYDLQDLKQLPNIKLLDYMERLITIGKFTQPEITLSLIYLKRISQNLKLTEINIHIIFSLSLLIASKYQEDDSFNIRQLSKLFGISFEEIKRLERNYVKYINWKLFVKKEEFDNLVLELKKIYDNLNFDEKSKKMKFILMIEREIQKLLVPTFRCCF